MALLLSAPLRAQNTEMPLRQGGLFGSTRPEKGNRDRLDWLVDASEGMQTELPLESRFRIGKSDLESGGFTSTLTSSAGYLRMRRRTQLAGSLVSSFKYYPRLDRVSVVGHGAGLGFTVRLPKESNLQLHSAAAYAPAYLYQLFPKAPVEDAAEPIAADADYRVDQGDSYAYNTNLSLNIGPPRKIRFTITGEYSHTDFQKEVVSRPNLTTSGGAARLSRGMTRNSDLSVEYNYRTATFGSRGITNEHRLSVGGGYSHRLSASRRANVQVRLSPSLLETPSALTADLVAPPSVDDGSDPVLNNRLYRLEGDARVEFDLGRSWRASATYRRGLEYLAVLTEPVFSDGWRLETGGLMSRRFDVSVVGGHAAGASALSRETRGLISDTGELRVRFALTRSLAVYSQYLYYHYDLREQWQLAPELPRVFEQHEIRVGLMLFVRPLSNKGR